MELPQDKLVELAQQGAERVGLPASMIYAMIMRESTGNPEAAHKSGARGLMQLMGPAAQEMGLSASDILDPTKNVRAGAGYLANMLMRFKDPKLALSAYNAGPGKTREAGGVTASAQPYVADVGDTVHEVTQPGQPFAHELDPEGAPSPARPHAQRVADMLLDLLGNGDVEVPERAPDYSQGYDKASIQRMLSQLRFDR